LTQLSPQSYSGTADYLWPGTEDQVFNEKIKQGRPMKNKKAFTPPWRDSAAASGTYRSIFKWGAPDGFKHPNARLYQMVKDSFDMTDADFEKPRHTGDTPVVVDPPPALEAEHVAALTRFVGKANVASDDYNRLKYATGKTMEEAMRLRREIVGDLPDLVVHPRDKQEVARVVAYCDRHGIPIYVYGGGSSVNFGFAPAKRGVTLVMNTHMNRLVAVNEANQTATVQPGLMGPAYERLLNDAPTQWGTRRCYTGGHFPQSFEYSSVGGWIVTLGSGQQSSYYGDMADIVVSQEYVTPAGTFRTRDYPAAATGPKVNDIMKGSEGAYGVLVEATVKIFRYMPENRRHFAFVFPDWESAVDAARDISQGEFGMPSMFRISDAEETDVALKLYGVEGTAIDRFMTFRGFKPSRRCLYIGFADGEKRFARNVKRQVKRICRRHGAMYITGFPAKKWEASRFRDPYLREDVNDFGIMIDTLEASVTWDNLHRLHREVRAFIKARPRTICMTHASHFYPQGTNLYFIFFARMAEIDEYRAFQAGIIDRIAGAGGSLSHHHGVGKMIAPWMERHLGPAQMDVLRALKQHFDPNNIMNPGGTLGLDIPADS
jgi:alkyldihydroxyacetonephosphate synthase